MLKKMLVLFAFMTLIFSVDSFAQYNNDNVRTGLGFGPVIGYSKAADADDGRFMIGAALRLRASRLIGLEAALGYRQDSYGDNAVKVKTWPLTFSGLVYPISGVYGLVGFGWYNTTFDYDSRFDNVANLDLGEETSSEFGFHLGGGLEIPFGESTTLFGDLRYVFLNYDFADIPETELGDISSNFYVISVGVLFGF